MVLRWASRQCWQANEKPVTLLHLSSQLFTAEISGRDDTRRDEERRTGGFNGVPISFGLYRPCTKYCQQQQRSSDCCTFCLLVVAVVGSGSGGCRCCCKVTVVAIRALLCLICSCRTRLSNQNVQELELVGASPALVPVLVIVGSKLSTQGRARVMPKCC